MTLILGDGQRAALRRVRAFLKEPIEKGAGLPLDLVERLMPQDQLDALTLGALRENRKDLHQYTALQPEIKELRRAGLL